MSASPEMLRRYKRQIGVYRDRTSGVLVAAWDKLPGYDEADVAEFEKATAAPLAGAKTAAVSLSAAFFAVALGIRPVGIRPRDVATFADTRGPFRATWHALSMGRPFEEAIGVGRSTAQALGFDFVQSAARLTGDVVAKASRRERVKWQRVPNADACEWCQSFEGVLFDSSEAADFGHERDDCDVVPA